MKGSPLTVCRSMGSLGFGRRGDPGQKAAGDGQQDGLVQQELVAVGHGVGVGDVHDEVQLLCFQHDPQLHGGHLHRVDFAVEELLIEGRHQRGQEQVAPVGADAQPQQLAAAGGNVAELGVQPPVGSVGLGGPLAEQLPGSFCLIRSG